MLDFDISTLIAAPRIFFVVREDHRTKPGGDIDLAKALSGQIAAGGGHPEIVIAADVPALDDRDILFLFNIDRPHDALVALGHATERTRVFLYALHHPQAGIEAYLRSGVSGAKRLLSTAANHQAGRYEALVDFAKAIRNRDMSRLRNAMLRQDGVATLLARCELLVVEEAELHAIEAAYGPAAHRAFRLPHPIAAKSVSAEATLGFHYALVAGRIEPRKNQLVGIKGLLAADVRALGLEIVVVGAPGSDWKYFEQVLRLCLENRVLYISQLPQSLFFPTVSNASIVINPSYFEVTSLIDLYAIAHKIPLLTTTFSWYEPSTNLVQLHPDSWLNDRETIRKSIGALLARP
jgi:glycosyltransferase involved in cell wall biosynthesis